MNKELKIIYQNYNMQVFKFGGASVKDANGVKNLAVCFTKSRL